MTRSRIEKKFIWPELTFDAEYRQGTYCRACQRGRGWNTVHEQEWRSGRGKGLQISLALSLTNILITIRFRLIRQDLPN